MPVQKPAVIFEAASRQRILKLLEEEPKKIPERRGVGQIPPFLRPADSFSPEVLKVLGKAYDTAIRSLDDIGQPDVVREVIAKRIIQAAQKGETDPAKLCAVALAAFNSDRLMR